MKITADIQFRFEHQLHFTHDALDPANNTLASCIAPGSDAPARALAFVDTGVARHHRDLPDRLRTYARAHADRLTLVGRVEPVVGGELCKNDRDAIYRTLNAIDAAHLDRQSYVLAIGGGAVLDCVGFAAAIAHRGVRLIRIPTTTLAQADSGVGVKNGINGFEKKNYLGSFAVPHAVINGEAMLATLDDRDWIAGFSEAVKVALLKDAALFHQIARDAEVIRHRDRAAALPVIRRSAELHLRHIADGGDPFELTTARPLDFGHWAAHKLEAITDYTLRHGEAVAIGLALDVTYAHRVGLLSADDAEAVRACLRRLGFTLHHDALRDADTLLAGLEEFREHLGGQLTITLLRAVADPIDVHTIDHAAMRDAIGTLVSPQRASAEPT
ncbi:MAG: 3-dehydroquinate synthase [Phycisphaeraceae bacterium]